MPRWRHSCAASSRTSRSTPLAERDATSWRKRWSSGGTTTTRPSTLRSWPRGAQTREELEDALARLPFIYRSVVMLHDVEGWTVAEIADLLELGLPAAKQRLRRGRMMLVTALAEGQERRIGLKGVPMRCWDARQHGRST